MAAINGITYHKRRWTTKGQRHETWAYRIRLEGPSVRTHRRSGYATKADAIAAAQLAAEELRQPSSRPSATGPKSLFSLLDAYLAEGTGHLRESSRFAESCDIRLIKRIIGTDIVLDELSRAKALSVWEHFITKRRAEVSIVRTRRELGCISRVCSWAVRRGVMDANPFAGMKRPKAPEAPPKSLTIHEARRLLSSAEGVVRAFIALCLLAGLRRNEALHLPWAHIDMDSAIIHIRNHEHHTTKSEWHELWVSMGSSSPSSTSIVRGILRLAGCSHLSRERIRRPLTANADPYIFDLIAGAGGCNDAAGEVVGTLTVDYDGSKATVRYEVDPGTELVETHLYVECEELPTARQGRNTVPTTAPGQYPLQDEDADERDETSATYEVNISCANGIYVVAHSVVCYFPEE